MYSCVGMVPVKTAYLSWPDWLSCSQTRYEDIFTLDIKVIRCARTEFLRNIVHLVIWNIPSDMQKVLVIRYCLDVHVWLCCTCVYVCYMLVVWPLAASWWCWCFTYGLRGRCRWDTILLLPTGSIIFSLFFFFFFFLLRNKQPPKQERT